LRRNDLFGQPTRAAIEAYHLYLWTEKQFLEQSLK
jgi:hypothetical protein